MFDTTEITAAKPVEMHEINAQTAREALSAAGFAPIDGNVESLANWCADDDCICERWTDLGGRQAEIVYDDERPAEGQLIAYAGVRLVLIGNCVLAI